MQESSNEKQSYEVFEERRLEGGEKHHLSGGDDMAIVSVVHR